MTTVLWLHIWIVAYWIVARVALQYELKSDFGFDYIHHLDAGFLLIILSCACDSFILFLTFTLFGIILIFDDVVGHVKRSQGLPEEFILEPLFRPIIKAIWSIWQ